ncbi:MAG: hypothetical protein FWC54_01575 [Actinomycetia bacterium]|nr:hypothetical protein [Actinomycetes bacterium]
MAKNLLYTAKATSLITRAKELERFCQAIEQASFMLTVLSAEDIRARAQAIVHEADTMALPKRLIPAARALGDGAWLIEQLIACAPARSHGHIMIDAEAYPEARAYTQKALEALKSPARFYGADTEVLETAGGLYL